MGGEGGAGTPRRGVPVPYFLSPCLEAAQGVRAEPATPGRSQKPGYFFLLLEIIIKKIRSQFPLIFLPSPDPDPSVLFLKYGGVGGASYFLNY